MKPVQRHLYAFSTGELVTGTDAVDAQTTLAKALVASGVSEEAMDVYVRGASVRRLSHQETLRAHALETPQTGADYLKGCTHYSEVLRGWTVS